MFRVFALIAAFAATPVAAQSVFEEIADTSCGTFLEAVSALPEDFADGTIPAAFRGFQFFYHGMIEGARISLPGVGHDALFNAMRARCADFPTLLFDLALMATAQDFRD